MPDAPPKVEIQLVPPSKSWSRSKTIWVNVGIVGSAAALAAVDVVMANQQLLIGSVPPRAYLITIGAVSVVNVLLRAITRTGVSWRKSPDEQA